MTLSMMSELAVEDGDPLLQVLDLHARFDTREGVARVVNGVSYTVRAGQTLGIVGESGCGKSVTAMSILRLLQVPPARIQGKVLLRGVDLLGISEREMRKIRGNCISMIFQEPMTSLNPVLSIGRQVAEAVMVHQNANRTEAMARAVEMLRLVQIPEPERRVNEYPHQLSGGMRQRVMIALALSCRPDVLIADEPTTALDVTVQAQIIDLIRKLQKEFGMGVVLITHDLGVVAESCDRVVVMYAGQKVEEASVFDLFDSPLHPYTRALMSSMPAMNSTRTRLTEISGLVPSPLEPRRGCAFAARCAFANGRCYAEIPQLANYGKDHITACFAVEEGRFGTQEDDNV